VAQIARRRGAEVVLVERAGRVPPREPAPLGEALGERLRRDGIELVLGSTPSAARRDGEDYVLGLADGRELRGDRLLVAAGRRPRVTGIGLERSASRRIRWAFPWTRTCGPASACGRSATWPRDRAHALRRVLGRGQRDHPAFPGARGGLPRRPEGARR
jgi:hypothetical protein